MIGAVDAEDALHLDVRGSLCGDSAYDSLGRENYLRIALTLQHLLVHFLVARADSRFAARSINDDFAARVSCAPLEIDCAALQLERCSESAVHIMDGHVDFGSCRIERDVNLLSYAGMTQKRQ